MSRRLPPLPAIRAFEAAARHGGFQQAGVELHLSAGAIAHQVKLLEAWLGILLFQRLARGVALTPAGRRYAEALRPHLNGLADVSETLQRQTDNRVVTVTSVPSLVTRWLMPRLGRLQQQHADIEMRVLASVPTLDLLHDGVDVAIRLGAGPYPRLKTDLLMEEWFSAVCSPAFRATLPASIETADLLRYPLLHDEIEMRIPEEIDWARWFRACGVAYTSNAGPSFSHSYLTLDAAANGQGVALGAEPMIAADLAGGRLVRVLPHRVCGPYQFHLLRTAAAENRPQVRAFCNWLKTEAAQDNLTP